MNKIIVALAFVVLLSLGFIFSQNGVIDVRTDTQVYVDQIKYYQGDTDIDREQIGLRAFKPFYGYVGSKLSIVMEETTAIFVINLILYFGLVVVTVLLLKELGFTLFYAAIGGAWVAMGYPVMKYGLSLLTDISGWFFAGFTIFLFLRAYKKNSVPLTVTASFVGFVGSLCKETGILGLFFGGVVLLSHLFVYKEVKYFKHLVALVVPFIIAQALFLFFLFSKSNSSASFIDWFFFNKNTVGYDLYTLYYFAFVHASTFNFLWVFVVAGVFSLWKKRKEIDKKQILLGCSLFLAVLPPLAWPVFMTRVLFIEYLFVVPLALIGLSFLVNKFPLRTSGILLVASLPLISSALLFFIAGGGSLFDRF